MSSFQFLQHTLTFHRFQGYKMVRSHGYDNQKYHKKWLWVRERTVNSSKLWLFAALTKQQANTVVISGLQLLFFYIF